MSHASPSIKAFRDYARADLTLEDLPRFEKEIYGANERAACMLWAAYLHSALVPAILSAMRKDMSRADTEALFSGEGALSRFSSRIRVGYALEVFGPKSRHDLDVIREIRNQVAHSFRPFRFAIPVVKKACTTLMLPDDFAALFIEKDWQKSRRRHRKGWKPDLQKPRDRFECAASTLLQGLVTVRVLRKHPHIAAMYLP
jgi:hypothetical protein